MKATIQILISLIFIISGTTVYALNRSDYYFKHITIENGLSQNSVLSILQDKKGFMWFGTKDGLNRYDGNSIKVYKKEDLNPHSLGNNFIWSLYEHTNNEMWVGTDRGIYIYNSENDKFSFFDTKTADGRQITVPILDMKRDKKGNVWIAADRLYRYSSKEGKLYDMYTDEDDSKIFPHTWSIYIDSDDQVWVCMHGIGIRKYQTHNTNSHQDIKTDNNGNSLSKIKFSQLMGFENNYIIAGTISGELYVVNKITNEIKPLFQSPSESFSKLYVRSIASIDSKIWIGSESGLYIFNSQSGTSKHITQNIYDRYSISDNAIYSVYKDREGGIWIGTYFGGVNFIPKQFSFFEKFYPIFGENTIKGERISGICKDNSGNIWIGTEDEGLNCFNPKTNGFEHFIPDNKPGSISYHNVHDIILDGNSMWVGLFNNGINIIDLTSKKVVKHYRKTSAPYSLDNDDIFALHRDKGGNIWIGTSSGAFLFDRENERFIKQPHLNKHFISDIMEDSKGNIWFATYNAGAFKYNPRTKEWKDYPFRDKDTTAICHYKIISIFEDSQNRIWFTGETGGICYYLEQSDSFKRYGLKDGFKSDVIYKILEDKNGTLWMSSNYGLISFNLKTKEVRNFNTGNGLLCNQFSYKSGFKDSDGKMYFGGINGLIAFYPESFIPNSYIPPIAITDFKILTEKKVFAPHHFDKSKGITLKYYMSSFSIDFSALSFSAPEQNKYAYRMVGLENEWVYLDKAQTITYSNLPYGKYQFQIKASNNDGVWNENVESIDIEILPPFWKTTFAYILYLIAIISIILYYIISHDRKLKKKAENEYLLFEKQKETELFNVKIEFFTNIAHEVRTPLTLIKSPLEYILGNDVDKKELNDNLKVMKKNTDRLLLLINQLLDFRKTESEAFSLTFVQTNVTELLNEVTGRFRLMATQKSLDLSIAISKKNIIADIDREALIKVISNLLTNGLKYSKSRIEIILSAESDYFEIRANSDGSPIPQELSEKIFEPFFQIKEHNTPTNKNGSGIGLALVKSLVELHGGRVYLDITQLPTNSFVVSIPILQDNSIILNEKDEIDFQQDIPSFDNIGVNKERILIVEDDEDMLAFLIDKLQKNYIAHYARNGVEALQVLDEEIINLIITDVMMPQMDGLQLCREIKQNIDYSHIPVILLTAKNTLGNKIEGLDSGADAYIDKPFSFDHLYAQISNLLNNRMKIREAFAHSPFIKTGSMAHNKADEVFLSKLNDIILKNISDPSFHVDQLAEALAMSRSSLLRKIKGISEFSPNDFIKIIRLKRAAEILQEGEYKINEVCFLVGFSSTSYFSKAFRKQFGVLPKDFIKQDRDEK